MKRFRKGRCTALYIQIPHKRLYAFFFLEKKKKELWSKILYKYIGYTFLLYTMSYKLHYETYEVLKKSGLTRQQIDKYSFVNLLLLP